MPTNLEVVTTALRILGLACLLGSVSGLNLKAGRRMYCLCLSGVDVLLASVASLLDLDQSEDMLWLEGLRTYEGR